MPAVIKPDLFFCSLSLVWTVWGDAFAAAAIGIVPVRIRVEPPCAQQVAVQMLRIDFYWKVWMELIVLVDVVVVVVVVGDDLQEE